MPPDPTTSSSSPARWESFATTRWTLVLAAGQKNGAEAEDALEQLCRTYWFPLYAYVRRRGHPKADAEDLTQEFFARLIARGFPAVLDSSKGKFRAFLLAALKHFLANEWDRSKTIKRGGDITHLSLDWQTADERFQLAASYGPSPDVAFDRDWAVVLLARVLERLEGECAAVGKSGQFSALKPFLAIHGGDTSYRTAAAGLGIDEGSARMAAHRLRKCCRTLLRHEIAQTLADPARADEELRELMGVFRL